MPEQDELDARRVAEIIQAQFTEVRPAIVRHLGEGYDSVAFEVDAGWVFRFPRRSEVEQQLLLEMRILPILAEQSPLPVPVFRFHGQPSTLFPRHFGGYAKLPGVPAIGLNPMKVPFDAWAPVLARFLSWLHAFPVDRAAQHGVERQEIAPLIEEVRADALSDFENLNRVAPDRPLEEWRAFLLAAPGVGDGPSSPLVLVHGDLAALFHWGGRPFVDAMLSSYDGRVDATTLRRAQFLAACRGVGDVTFGLATGRREYIDAGIRALTLCTG